MTEGATGQFKMIRDLAVRAGIAFNNAEVITNANMSRERDLRTHCFELRDALLYRLDATLYHLERITVVQQAAEKRLYEHPDLIREQRQLLDAVVREQRILFDDLVFNAVSFFDYLGRFCWTLLQEEPNGKLRWDKAYKWAKHGAAGADRTNRIHGTVVEDAIVAADERWVRRLTEFRSGIIHYKSERMRGTVTAEFTRAEGNAFVRTHTLEPQAPEEFAKVAKNWNKPVEQSLAKDATTLVHELISEAQTILETLAAELEAQVPERESGAVLTSPVLVKRNDGT